MFAGKYYWIMTQNYKSIAWLFGKHILRLQNIHVRCITYFSSLVLSSLIKLMKYNLLLYVLNYSYLSKNGTRSNGIMLYLVEKMFCYCSLFHSLLDVQILLPFTLYISVYIYHSYLWCRLWIFYKLWKCLFVCEFHMTKYALFKCYFSLFNHVQIFGRNLHYKL